MKPVRQIVHAALMATILVASKYALDALPNIEIISVMIIAYTLEAPKLTLPAIYTYIMLYGLLNGFGIWWFPQLYIWLMLYLLVRTFKNVDSVLFWAILSAIFGICYGGLYAISYGLLNGVTAGFAWWITGIPFDILHGVGNFICTMILLKPLRSILRRMQTTFY